MIDPAFAPYLAQPPQTQRRQSYAPADLGVDPAFAPYIAQPNFTTRVVNSDSAPVDEQSDESIMQQMAGTTLSGLAAFGNLFDLPGSSVRDILTGNNPLDQWMTPFSADNRTTGRELLTDWGVTRANDPTRWELADVGGFAAEVALDPFTWVGPGAVAKTIGKGAGKFVPKAVKTYAKNSAVGKAVGKVGREFNRHFDSKVMGTKSAKGQAAARKLYDAELGGTQEAYFDLNPIIQGFAESADPAALGDKLRRHAELVGTQGYAGKLDDVEQAIYDASMNLLDGDLGELSAIGAKIKEMDDAIGYWPRSMSDQAKEAFEGISTGETRPPSLFSVFSPNWLGRQDWLKGWKRGTEHVDTVFSDGMWEDMLKDIDARGLGRDTALDEISEAIAEKYGDDIERFYTKAELDENGFPVTVDGEEVVKEVDRYREIAKRIIDVPEWNKFGVFQNNALMDLANAHIANKVKFNTIQSTYDILATPGNILEKSAPTFRKSGENFVTVNDMLKNMDVDLDVGAKEIMDRIGLDSGTQAARNRFRQKLVDQDLADDLQSAWKYWDTPDEIKDLGKTWRSVTSLFKAGVLTHPARYTRDVMSAMVRNAERGMWSPKDMYTAGRVLFGQEVTGLSEIPAVRAWLEESGREVTDQNASLAVREMLGNMRASNVYQNTDTAFSGQAGKNVPKTQYHRQRVYKQMADVFGQQEADSLIQVTDARAAWAQKNAGIDADSYYRDRIGDIRAWDTAEQFEQSLKGGEDVLRQGGPRIGGQGLDIAFDATDGAPPYINVTKNGDYVGEIAMNTQTPLQERFVREKFNIPDSEKVSRIYGINVDDKFRGQGLGKRLYLEMADQVDGWIWNNQSSDDAIRTLDSLKRDGLLEVRWEDAGNRVRNQHRIMRITDKGREALDAARKSTDAPSPRTAAQPNGPGMPGYTLYQGKKGAVQFDQANKATIHWFKNNADVSTAAHEIGHIFRRDLADYAPELHERAMKALGVKDAGNWTRAEEEAFAEQWEGYLKNGQAPNKALTGVFQQFKEWLGNIYRSLTGQPQAVNPELKRVFDDMLSEAPNSPQAFGDYKSIDSLLETTVAGQRPGTASTLGQSLQEMGADLIGASPETNLNPMNVAGNAIGNAGDVRRRSQFGPVVVGDRVGRYTDDLSRLTPLLHQLRKMSPSQIDEAGGIFNAVKREMDDIQKMQIDYSPRSFTRTEQALKQVFPFYSFMRGNLAYVASEMVGNRAKKGMFAPGAGLRNNVRAGRLMTGEDDGYAPQYVSETTSVNMGELPDGSRRYLTGLGLMHEDPFSLLTFNKNSSLPDLGDAGIELMSRMNPMVKAPIEYATGESFFQRGPMGGRDLGDMDPLVGRLASNVSEMLGGDPLVDASGRQALPMGGVMPVGGGLMEHIIANSPVSRILSTARQITDQRKWQPLELPGGVDVPFGGLAANTLTGARFTDVSLPAQQAVMNDKINAYGRENLDARVYQNVYVPKEVIAEYEKTDPAKARKAKVINRAKQIFKKKREAVEAGQDK